MADFPSTPDVPSGLRARLVSRPRLIERLSAGIGRKLTLISAPAGFGMTTLVTDWLSLDEGDNNPARFFNYLLAPLQRHDPKSTVR